MSFVLAWIASLFEVDSTLAQRIAGGDQAALRQLYDRLAPRVRAVALRVLGAAGDADDVVQETFLDVWNRAATFDPDRGSLVSWVTTIGHRRAVDRLRRRGTRPGPGDAGAAVAREPSADATPHESAEERQARERIVAALASLPRDQREAIELMYFHGMSQREAAEHTGAALGTFKSRVRAAMGRLSGLLDELAPEAGA
ncbi:MAG: sigma-70 family RNA polymerase sigma factor [Kofleriaceae bacterium]